MRGWPHAKIMTQLSDVRCGLVVLWKRGRKFTGGYGEAKLKVCIGHLPGDMRAMGAHAHAHGHAHAHVTCTCTCTCAYSIPRALWHVHEPICACPLRALIMCMCLATLCTVLEWMRAPLQFAWMCNIALLLTIIALLLWDILSYYGEIPFGSVLVSMVIADALGLASASPPSNRSPV